MNRLAIILALIALALAALVLVPPGLITSDRQEPESYAPEPIEHCSLP